MPFSPITISSFFFLFVINFVKQHLESLTPSRSKYSSSLTFLSSAPLRICSLQHHHPWLQCVDFTKFTAVSCLGHSDGQHLAKPLISSVKEDKGNRCMVTSPTAVCPPSYTSSGVLKYIVRSSFCLNLAVTPCSTTLREYLCQKYCNSSR